MQMDKDEVATDAEIPESIVKVLKSVASALADSLTEVKERLFTLEVEVRMLGSRVDQLEELIASNDQKKSSVIPQLASTTSTIKQDALSTSTITPSSIQMEMSGNSLSHHPQIQSSRLTPSSSTISDTSTSTVAFKDSDDQKTPQPSPSRMRPRRRLLSTTGTKPKDEKKQEKDELLKALRLIDSL